MLVELFLTLAFEEVFVLFAVLFVEIYGRSNVEIMKKACHMKKDRMASLCHVSAGFFCALGRTYFCNAKELHCRSASIEHAFFGFDLLEHQLLCHLIEVCRQCWTPPLLVLFCIVSLQRLHILRHLFQRLLKLARSRLTRVEGAIHDLDWRTFLSTTISSLSFFAERGDASTLARVFDVSARARFAGVLATVPGMMGGLKATKG